MQQRKRDGAPGIALVGTEAVKIIGDIPEGTGIWGRTKDDPTTVHFFIPVKCKRGWALKSFCPTSKGGGHGWLFIPFPQWVPTKEPPTCQRCLESLKLLEQNHDHDGKAISYQPMGEKAEV